MAIFGSRSSNSSSKTAHVSKYSTLTFTTMDDLFSAALQDTCNSDVHVAVTAKPACIHEVTPHQGMAPSQGLTPHQDAGTDLITTSGEEPVVSSEHADLVKFEATPILHLIKPSEQHKRPSLVPVIPGTTKRKNNPRNSLQLTRIRCVDGDAVASVFIDCGVIDGAPQVTGCPVIVPRWCQYTAAWRRVNFGSSKWLIVNNYEAWVMGLINAVTTRSVRMVAKTFFDHFKYHFDAALTAARINSNHLEHPLDAIDDDDPTAAPSSDNCSLAILEINLGDFNITTINTTRRYTLQLDDAAINFIQGWVMPLMRKCAANKSCAANKASSEEQLESAPSTAPFQLPECMTPNIRGKVCWIPTANKWQVMIKYAKGAQGNPSADIAVPTDLDAVAFEQQKVAAYWRAVNCWNDLDISTRHRIPITRFD